MRASIELQMTATIKTCINELVRRLTASKSKSSEEASLFVHTSGRWLWNESFQQKQHTRYFDVTALKKVIAERVLPGCNLKSIRFSKLAEGGSNKIFLITTRQRRLIVKIPDPVVPSRLITASEVATLQFLRDELGLPIPKVLAWNDDEANPVGCEYIVMEEASGQALNEAWPTLSNEKKFTVIDDIISIQVRLIQGSRKFDAYGSLYFTQHASSLGLPISHISSQTQPAKYCIGPLAVHHLLKAGLRTSGINCGPWKTAYEYFEALISSSSAQVRQNPDGLHLKCRPFSFPVNPVSDTSSTALLRLLDNLLKATSCLVEPESLRYNPTIWHRDLHLGNIFISPEGNITSVIDWQDTATLPLFLSVRVPQFIDIDQDELVLELPTGLQNMPDSTQSQIVDRFRRSMLQQYYLASLSKKLPTVIDAITDPAHNLVRQVESFSQVSYGHENEALLLRQCLIELKRHWLELFQGTAPPCPIVISDGEIESHMVDGGYYNEFKDRLIQENIPIANEGWVHQEDFHERRKSLKRVVERVMSSLDSQVKQEEFRLRLNGWNVSGR